MDALLKSKYNYEINKCALVQGDIHSVWAYIIDITDNKDEIEFDGFVCSRGTFVDNKNEIQDYINNDEGFAPPLLSKYKNKFSLVENLIEEDINIVWKKNIIEIFIKEEKRLVMDLNTKKSFSKAISKSGPYGNPLD